MFRGHTEIGAECADPMLNKTIPTEFFTRNRQCLSEEQAKKDAVCAMVKNLRDALNSDPCRKSAILGEEAQHHTSVIRSARPAPALGLPTDR